MTELATLENRLKRKQKLFNEGVTKLQGILDNDNITENLAHRELEKLEVVLTDVRIAIEPVIEAYEKVTGNDAVDVKLEDTEKRMQENQEIYIDFKHSIKEKFPPAAAVAAINNITVQQAIQPVVPPPPPPKQYIRLQEIQIPDFDGTRKIYPRFISMFNNNVDEREDLPDVAKLTLFLALLKGEAMKRVESYPITPENYKVIKDVIEAEYGKKDLIIDCHLKKLFQLMSSPPAASDADFQSLYIDVSNEARALKALGHNEESLKSTVMTLLPEKMPSDMKLQWYRQINGKELATITLHQLYDFIELEVSVRARFKASTRLDTQASSHQEVDRDRHHRPKPKGHDTMAALIASSNPTSVVPPCMFCSSTEHKSGTCPKSVKERKEIFKKQKRCYRCSRKGHDAEKCDRVCHHCREEHHIYTCEAKAAAERSHSAAAISASSNTVLKTLCAKALGPKGESKLRIFIDSDSSRTYIT